MSVPRACILQGAAGIQSLRTFDSLAECNSAIRQIENLRYAALRSHWPPDLGSSNVDVRLHVARRIGGLDPDNEI